MALADRLSRRVRASKDDFLDEDFSRNVSAARSSTASFSQSDRKEGSASGDEGSHTVDIDDDDNEASICSSSTPRILANISFGALASAQASLTKTRKISSLAPKKVDNPRSRSPSPFPEAAERIAGKNAPKPATRLSKHAPTELSSKKAVSRKRAVIGLSFPLARDPRFSGLSGTLDTEKLKRNYYFLQSYRASEIAHLKSSVRSTKDNATKGALQRELLSMESREKAYAKEEVEQEVLREHRRKEREAVKDGKQPFFLKKGEITQRALVKRFESMGQKKVTKVIERRRKKAAGKEKKGMPAARRGLETSAEG